MKISHKVAQIIIKIIIISLAPILLIHLPFIFHLKNFWGIPLGDSGMQVIFSNWDGPNYVYNAITNYAKPAIEAKPFLNIAEYYPAHFPGLSWLIAFVAPIFGFFWGPIILQLIGSIILNFSFYFFIKSKSKHPLWLTFVFTFFPPRFIAVRSVIGADVWVTLLIILTLFFWEKKRYILAGLFSFAAVIFKFQSLIIPIVLLFASFVNVYKSRKINWAQFSAAFLGFAGYVTVALYYQVITGNFDAYFVAQKFVGMSASMPFAMFNYSQRWVGTGWMESAALYFVAIFIMISKLILDKRYLYAAFGILYSAMLMLIPQVDIMRLAMPLTPFFFYAFSDFLSSKSFRWGLIVSIPAIYLFAINFIVKNQAPISDWSLFR